MATSTNLALRPFRNERLPWLLAGALLTVAVILSIVHARFVNRLLSGAEADTVRIVRQNEARVAELEQKVANEPPLKIEASELARLRALKELVDRRVFPWRRLLSDLEETLSENVRLTNISPAPSRLSRAVEVALEGEARSKDAAFSFAETLEGSVPFSEVVLKRLDEQDGIVKFTVEAAFDAGAEAERSKTNAVGNPATTASPVPVVGTASPAGRKTR